MLMVDISDVWIDGVCINDDYAGSDVNFPMGLGYSNGVQRGHGACELLTR